MTVVVESFEHALSTDETRPAAGWSWVVGVLGVAWTVYTTWWVLRQDST